MTAIGQATNANTGQVRWWLVIGDWLILFLFVFIGQRDHGMAVVGALPSLFTTTLAIGVPWTVAALLLGTFRYGAGLSWQTWLGRVLTTWLVAAPLGLILRALFRGQASIPVPFMLVLLGLGGLFMLGWRALAYWRLSRRPI